MKRKQRAGANIPLNPLVPMVTFGLLVLLALGCGKKPFATPVDDHSPDFPKNRFLTAEGVGDTEMDARRQAMAELSSVFESRVHSQTTSLATSSLGADNMELFEKTIESRIRIISSVRLEGAKIGKVWQDVAGKSFHALAILDRVDAGRNWTHDLERLDNRLRAEALALETMVGRLPRMAALNRIMSLSLERHAIESRLAVVDYPYMHELELDMAKMTSELAVIRSDLRFYVDVTGEHGPVVGKSLAQALTRNGILITLDMDRADAWVMGRVEVTPLSLGNPKIIFVRAAGNVAEWVLIGHEKDLFSAVGSAKIGKSGMQFAKTAALAQGRNELARQLSVKVESLVNNFVLQTGLDDDQLVDRLGKQVSRQVTNETLSGSRQKDVWISPSSELYVLVFMETNGVKQSIRNQVISSYKKEDARWQRFQAQNAEEELDKELEKAFK